MEQLDIRNVFPQSGIMTVFSWYIYKTISSVKNQTGKVELTRDNHDYNTKNNMVSRPSYNPTLQFFLWKKLKYIQELNIQFITKSHNNKL